MKNSDDDFFWNILTFKVIYSFLSTHATALQTDNTTWSV